MKEVKLKLSFSWLIITINIKTTCYLNDQLFLTAIQ